ncbi:hypothetical protein BG011_006974 [Mortierella polycephala]|uniref:Uncharacterized protein n=1 Tax=Mortierella polycephala TaxID=41804 RepID=A0A9P6U901_9FUNG|nr:hypothetical protein BG011_006974 [Mortierella polycephala]
MSLLHRTARRSFKIALSSNTSAISRLPFVARPLSSKAPKQGENELLKNAPGWRHEDASESEASVKADREPAFRNVQDLQDETAEHMKRNGSHSSNTTVDSMKDAANNMKDKVSQKSKEYTEKGKEYYEKTKVEAGEVTEDILQGRAKINASPKDESVLGSVKAEAQKAKEHAQESFESAKKAVGMDPNN